MRKLFKKKPITHYSLVRILSFAVILLLLILDRYMGNLSWQNLCLDIYCGICIAVLFPSSYEDSMPSLGFAAIVSFLLPALGILLSDVVFRFDLIVGSCVLANICYTVYRARNKFRAVRALFRIDSVWCNVEDYVFMFYNCIFVFIAAVLILFEKSGFPPIAYETLALAILGFYVLLLVRAHTGLTLFLSSRKEKEIKEIIHTNVRTNDDPELLDDQMNAVYTKILAHMDEKKPFLDENFDVDDLAASVFCNRAYVSKAINYYSGRNFKQFVNYYRVCYSIELMRKDRRLKVIELAVHSGFHSVVTYNMAFKLYMNTTPSAYCSQMYARDRALRRKEALKPIPLPPDTKDGPPVKED